MRDDKPLISILMAVYHPRMDWLVEQLDSLNQQTYPNVELIICDDGPDSPVDEAVFAAHITAFPWRLVRNEQNLGSNRTFERLTGMANGQYIAYCDQDDIWLPEKLSVLQEALTIHRAILVCSDMHIINAQGTRIAESITQVRRHHVFRSGTGLAKGLLVKNFVTGCTMLVASDAARSAVPFCPYMVHDHYLALWCAERGKIESLALPCIQYRLHSGNQTGIMTGVVDKKSYGILRIESMIHRMQWLTKEFSCCKETKTTTNEILLWLLARQQNWFYGGGIRKIWKYRKFGVLPSMAEIVLKYVPEYLFTKAIKLTRENKV